MMTDWTSDDRDILREYLKRADSKILTYLKSRVPKVDAKTIEETALQAKEAKGANDIIDELESASLAIKAPVDPGFRDTTVGLS